MKKLLLVAAASFFSGVVYAQIETPTTQYDDYGAKELMCTEKAISFRANIRSGWQLSSFRMGYTDIVNGSSGFTASKNYVKDDLIEEPIQLVKFENAINQHGTYLNENFLFLPKTSLTQTNQSANDNFLYKYNDSLQLKNFNFLMPPLN
jgi:hypothetical protein